MLNKAILFTTAFVFDVPFEGLFCSMKLMEDLSILALVGIGGTYV